MSNKKTVAVNKTTGTKYTRANCKNGVCRVSTRKSHFSVNKSAIQFVK